MLKLTHKVFFTLHTRRQNTHMLNTAIPGSHTLNGCHVLVCAEAASSSGGGGASTSHALAAAGASSARTLTNSPSAQGAAIGKAPMSPPPAKPKDAAADAAAPASAAGADAPAAGAEAGAAGALSGAAATGGKEGAPAAPGVVQETPATKQPGKPRCCQTVMGLCACQSASTFAKVQPSEHECVQSHVTTICHKLALTRLSPCSLPRAARGSRARKTPLASTAQGAAPAAAAAGRGAAASKWGI